VLAIVNSSALLADLVGAIAIACCILFLVLYIKRRRRLADADDGAEPIEAGGASRKGQFRAAFEAGRQAYRKAEGDSDNEP